MLSLLDNISFSIQNSHNDETASICMCSVVHKPESVEYRILRSPLSHHAKGLLPNILMNLMEKTTGTICCLITMGARPGSSIQQCFFQLTLLFSPLTGHKKR